MQFKVDDRVKYASSQEGLGGSVSDRLGTVTKVHDTEWVSVQWDADPVGTSRVIAVVLLVAADEV